MFVTCSSILTLSSLVVRPTYCREHGHLEVTIERILGEDQPHIKITTNRGGVEGMERTLQNPTYYTTVPQRVYRQRGKQGGARKKKTKGQLDAGIFYLAGVSFSEDELRVLAQGLKFAPDKNIYKFQLFIDIEKYIRKLNIKKFFASRSFTNPLGAGETGYQHSGLKNNSVFNPQKGTHHHIEVFKRLVQDKVKQIEVKKAKTIF